MADKEAPEYVSLIFNAEELRSLHSLPANMQKGFIDRRLARINAQMEKAKNGGVDLSAPVPDIPVASTADRPDGKAIAAKILSIAQEEAKARGQRG